MTLFPSAAGILAVMQEHHRLALFRATLAKRHRTGDRLHKAIAGMRQTLAEQMAQQASAQEYARSAAQAVRDCEAKLSDLIASPRCPVDRLLAMQRHLAIVVDRHAERQAQEASATEAVRMTRESLDALRVQLVRNQASEQAQRGVVDTLWRGIARAAEAEVDEQAEEVAQARRAMPRTPSGNS